MIRTIDEIHDTPPEDLLPADYTMLIAWHRKQREEGEGVKLKKDKGPPLAISIEELGLARPKPKLDFKRRI